MSIKSLREEFFAWLQGREPTKKNCALWMQERALADIETELRKGLTEHRSCGPENVEHERLISDWLKQVLRQEQQRNLPVMSAHVAVKVGGKKGGKKGAATKKAAVSQRNTRVRAAAKLLMKSGTTTKADIKQKLSEQFGRSTKQIGRIVWPKKDT